MFVISCVRNFNKIIKNKITISTTCIHAYSRTYIRKHMFQFNLPLNWSVRCRMTFQLMYTVCMYACIDTHRCKTVSVFRQSTYTRTHVHEAHILSHKRQLEPRIFVCHAIHAITHCPIQWKKSYSHK